jgi:hypothetical protein
MADVPSVHDTDADESKKKWSINDMPVRVRDAAVIAAEERRMYVWELVAAAIEHYLGQSASNPPSAPSRNGAARHEADALGVVERAITAAAELAQARGKKVPDRVAGPLNRALLALLPPDAAGNPLAVGPATYPPVSGSQADRKPGPLS